MTLEFRAPDGRSDRRQCLRALAVLSLNGVTALRAQTLTHELSGLTPDGRRFRLSEQRGKVVLVIHWSTSCAVCRDKMAELRVNLAGWSGKPFQIIGVNMDARQQDFQNYDALLRQTTVPARRFDSLWAGQADFIDTLGPPSSLPEACLIDKQGALVARYSGRIPAQTWDRIAELL